MRIIEEQLSGCGHSKWLVGADIDGCACLDKI